MKTALILFKSSLAPLDAKHLDGVMQSLSQNGFPVSTVKILSLSDDFGFKASVKEFKDTVDNLIIAYHPQVDFDVKKIIADLTDTTLIENENAVHFVKAVSNAHGREYPLSNALIPMEATLIPNETGAFQGFVLDDNEFTLALLSNEQSEFSEACEKYLVPYCQSKLKSKNKILIFKYFGGETSLKNTIDKVIEQAKNQVQTSLECENGDWTIRIACSEEDEKVIARTIISELKEDVYAECQTDLGERLFDLLRLRKLKLATAESFRGGRVVSSVIKNPGASSFVHEGIVAYSNQSKAHRLNINEADILKDGAVSSMTAYRMAAGLLKTGKADIAISTTGFAGPKTPDSTEPVGLCFIGIGMMDGVHTYRLNLHGSREEITETAKNTALFLAIKKLKSK